MSKERRDAKVKDLIVLAKSSDVPQIVLDSFEADFTKKFFDLEIKNQTLIKRGILCYKEHSNLINRLPQEVATSFIYSYCTQFENKDEIVSGYDYCKGYRDIFYLLQGVHISGVFVIYNGVSLQKNIEKYGSSDFSWGAIQLDKLDSSESNIRISGNSMQTGDVILRAVFPNDELKLNFLPLFVETFLAKQAIYQSNSSFSKQDVLKWLNEFNLVKRVAIERKMTYKELGEEVGFGEGAMKNAGASGKLSDQLKKAMELYIENLELLEEIKKYRKFQYLMKEFTNIVY